MLCKHQSLPHAAYFHLFLHHDGSEDSCWTSQFSAPPPAVSRPEVVSAPSALLFPIKFLMTLSKLRRKEVKNPTLPCHILANFAKRGEEEGEKKKGGLRKG